MPPSTSLSDCFWLLAFSMVAGSVHFLLGLAGVFRPAEARQFAWSLSRKEPSRNVEPAEASSVIQRYYCSPSAFFISWLPWFAFSAGSIVVSLLRDAGFQIFPWPILANCGLFSVWLLIAGRLKLHRVSQILSVAGAQRAGDHER